MIMPKKAIPVVGYNAYCEDPEGNEIGIRETAPSAAGNSKKPRPR
jgi:predicted enzyme related to lactoylglutathione lyase